jgi:hypothetical protein
MRKVFPKLNIGGKVCITYNGRIIEVGSPEYKNLVYGTKEPKSEMIGKSGTVKVEAENKSLAHLALRISTAHKLLFATPPT